MFLQALKNVVLYVLLAPHSNEQWDLLVRVKEDRNLEKIPLYKYVFTCPKLL